MSVAGESPAITADRFGIRTAMPVRQRRRLGRAGGALPWGRGGRMDTHSSITTGLPPAHPSPTTTDSSAHRRDEAPDSSSPALPRSASTSPTPSTESPGTIKRRHTSRARKRAPGGSDRRSNRESSRAAGCDPVSPGDARNLPLAPLHARVWVPGYLYSAQASPN